MGIFFSHIWKTGGLSVQKAFRDTFSPKRCFDIVDVFIRNEDLKKVESPIVFGHAPVSLNRIIQQPVFTIFRDPVERILSYWNHIKRENQPGLLSHAYNWEGSKIVKNMVFQTVCCNMQTKMLGIEVNFEELLAQTLLRPGLENRRKYWTLEYIRLVRQALFLKPCEMKEFHLAQHVLAMTNYTFLDDIDQGVSQLFTSLGAELKELPHVNKDKKIINQLDTPEL